LSAACSSGGQPRTVPTVDAPSAHRIIFWTNCADLMQTSQKELLQWKQRGVGGFVCQSGFLDGFGGSQSFTADPNASLDDPAFGLQRTLRDTHFVQRAAALGIKMYLGFYFANQQNDATTPLVNWFDDAGWTDLLREITTMAAFAKQYGFAGLAFDQELYPRPGAVQSATWDWDYLGNDHSEEAVRSEAELRGKALMSAILRGFPRVEIAAYDVVFPGTWHDYLEEQVNGVTGASRDSVQIDFWAGLTSIPGYAALRLYDSDFYKATQTGDDWGSALRYQYTHVASVLSKRLPNWDEVSKRLSVTPFSWIDGDVAKYGEFAAPRSPSYVRQQLEEFRKWGMGGEFANYESGSLADFDYGPYLDALRAGSQKGPIETAPPSLTVSEARASSSCRGVLAGEATDPFAVWAVTWRADSGASGSAELTPNADGVATGPTVASDWRVHDVALQQGHNRVTVSAVDSKGLKVSKHVEIDC
jgi:hypothetical protein